MDMQQCVITASVHTTMHHSLAVASTHHCIPAYDYAPPPGCCQRTGTLAHQNTIAIEDAPLSDHRQCTEVRDYSVTWLIPFAVDKQQTLLPSTLMETPRHTRTLTT